MKKIFLIMIVVLLTANLFAQAPQKMSYQAVIRNASNTLITNTTVGMRLSILQGSEFGASVYVETQTPTTNTNGLASLEIGNGTVILGTFSSIDWSNGPYFIKTETDPTGGSAYSIIGTSQLMSVPYALFAANANNYISGSGISIAGNTISNSSPDQTISIVGTGNTNITGTYPNFTVNTPNYSGGTGISVVGNVISNTSPNQTVSLTGAGGTTVTGSYPTYTVTTPRIIRGTSSGGFAPTIINGSGFTVVHTSSGTYTVTFTTPFTTTPTATVSLYNTQFMDLGAIVYSISTTNLVIKTGTGDGNASYTYLDNLGFSFIAIDN